MNDTTIQCGDKVKDTVTGLKGIVTGVAVYLNGCVQALIEPPVREGQDYREIWIDEDRLQVILKPKARKKEVVRKKGGPNSRPPARSAGRGR